MTKKNKALKFWSKKEVKTETVSKTVEQNPATFVPIGLQWLAEQINGSPIQWYLTNPILNSIVNKRATCLTNARFKVININTGKEIDNDPLLNRIENPNNFQSKSEYLKSLCIFASTYGTAYISGVSDSVGFEKNVINGQLVSLMPENLIINQTQRSLFNYDYTISYNDFGVENKIDKNNCYPIFDTTTGITQQGFLNNIVGMMGGTSRCQSIKQNISTLNDAFISRGIISKTPGGLWFVSSDASSSNLFPLQDKEKESLQKNLIETYGVSKAKAQLIATSSAVSATKLSIPYQDLGLDNIVNSEIEILLSVFNMPKDLFSSKSNSSLAPDSLTAVLVSYYQDEIIPLANNIANTITDFYGYNKIGKKLVASFDHLPIFQENLKTKASIVLQAANAVGKLTDLSVEERRQILVDLGVIKIANNG